MYLPFLYAETHYHLKFLYPLYYKKEPEIITDIPTRVIKSISKKIPILLLIKDADKFPVFVEKLEITVLQKNKTTKEIIPVHLHISDSYFSKIFFIDPKIKEEQKILLYVKIFYKINTKNKTALQDNYFGLKKIPFTCYYSLSGLPLPDNWFAGDVHYHSNFTSDQVEFGADISSTKTFANVMGLNWLFVTDHSYDLDDDENNYLKNDPALVKWQKLKQIAKKLSSDNFKIIHGEELSVGNSENKNVHLLIINSDNFIKGYGDSAEKWFRNNPTENLNNLKVSSREVLMIPAHPFEKIPLAQKLTLKRGSWNNDELKNFAFIQPFNGNNIQESDKLIKKWVHLLLEGAKILIVAGNDAHGNFNLMKQIKIPFLKLFVSKEQIFGKWMTYFYYSSNNPIKGIYNKKIVVSNGPFLDFYIENISKKKFYIGDSAPEGEYTIIYNAASNDEFGKIKNITLFIGKKNKAEKRLILKSGCKMMFFDSIYIRMELITYKNYKAFTNPIWFLTY